MCPGVGLDWNGIWNITIKTDNYNQDRLLFNYFFELVIFMFVDKKDISDLISKIENLLNDAKKLKKSAMYNGWSVYECSGYTKAVKRIKGKVCSLHLGKSPMLPDDILKKIGEFKNQDEHHEKIATAIEKMPAADREYVKSILRGEK
jgi:hypothetical protein